MKKISEIAVTLPATIDRSEVAIPARTTALDRKDFDKIEYQIGKYFEIREIVDSLSVWKEELGRSEFMTRHKGREITPKGEIVPGGLVDAIRRPSTPAHINVHLTRLTAHKRQTKGGAAHKIIMEDLAYDLNGVSEWAVAKACEEFRRDPSPFFPDTPVVLAKVKGYEDMARSFGEPTPPPPKALPKDEWNPPTDEQKKSVSELLRRHGIGSNSEATEEKVENEFQRPSEPGCSEDNATE